MESGVLLLGWGKNQQPQGPFLEQVGDPCTTGYSDTVNMCKRQGAPPLHFLAKDAEHNSMFMCLFSQLVNASVFESFNLH